MPSASAGADTAMKVIKLSVSTKRRLRMGVLLGWVPPRYLTPVSALYLRMAGGGAYLALIPAVPGS